MRHSSSLVLLLFAAVALTSCSEQASTSTPSASAATTGSDAAAAPGFAASELLAAPITDWLTSGGNLYNQRYSPLTEINRDTIAGVKAEWQVHLGSGLGPQHSGQGEPLVHEGVIYHVTGQNDVFALSVDTGEILWKYQPALDTSGVVVCCGWAVRGLAIGQGLVFVPRLDAHLLALDQKTGAVVWDVEVAKSAEGYSITGAPRYFDGKVYSGVAGGEYQTRGSMQAFDAATGAQLWTFNTVPGPGEFGHETWPAVNDSWRYGGAPVWQTAAIDPELNQLYFSTGNASPDLNGSLRKGDNLFTVSIVALDASTGAYRWHFQETRHDIWDYDASSPVVLFDVEKDGVLRKGLSQISKSGYLFLLDRVTGAGLTPILDTPVPQLPEQFTAATQPIPQGDTMINHCITQAPAGWTLVNDGCTYTPFGREPVLYAPLSGSNWQPTAYDPRLGHLFLCASESIGGAVMQDWNPAQLGRQTGQMIYGGAFQLPRDTPRHAYQIAVDVRSHDIVWKFESAVGCSTGATVTAGGLLLIGRSDARLHAFDSSSGEELWSFQLDAPPVPSPVVFEHEGRQKILLFAGGSLFAGGGRSDSLWLLSLDGTLGEARNVAAPIAPPSITLDSDPEALPPLALPESAVDLARGKEIYDAVCLACHGADGQGGHAEGGAMPRDSTLEAIFSKASRGSSKMPAFASVYTPAELKSVAGYVRDSVLR